MTIKCPKCRADNPETQRFCGECGTRLDAAGFTPEPEVPPSGLVARPSLTRTLEAPIESLTRGALFAGRYEIIEELGRGGMGSVYRVFDKKVESEVALKLIKPEISAEKRTIDRFRNELRLAREISHRHVCRMYDLNEEKGAFYITMEYVDGEDLRSMIRMSKQLSVAAAVSIAKQACEGLAEAHRRGVIHRDLKPGNIMIDKDGNTRIMDFGIARSLKTKGITGEGAMIGTPEYMSPEQAEAKDTDRRSDIYSLGVILYEMVTGRLPFEGDTPLAVAMKHKGEVPKSPKTLNPQISDALNQVILKCLEKDQERRYGSAEELCGDLEKIEQGLPISERAIPKRKPFTSKEITVTFSAKKLIIPALAFVLLIAAGIIIWRVLPAKKAAPPPSATGQPTLAVLYFENRSGEDKLDFWRSALPELLITDLSQSKYIRVVSGDEMLTILRRLGLAEAQEYSSEDIGKIAAQTRATHVLRGSFIKAGESIIITAGLQKPGTGESARTLRLEAHGENEIIPKVDELTRQVKEGLNLTAAQIAGDIEKELGQITTSSPEALKYYIEGRRRHNKIEYDQAIAYMEKAVEIDPGFAMAYRSLAMSHMGLGYSAEGRKYLEKALKLSARLPENERLLIEGQASYYDENYAKAIEILEGLVRVYPGYLLGRSSLALAYSSAGESDKAIECQEFVAQTHKTGIAVGNLAAYYLAKGLYQKAEDVCRAFLQDVEDNSWVRDRLGWSYLCRRQFDLALAEAEKVFLLGPDRQGHIGEGLLLKGDVLVLTGDITGAEKAYKQVFGKDRASGRRGQYLLALIRGKYAEAVSLLQQNLEESRGNKASEARGYRELSDALEKAGRYEKAYRSFNQYLKLSAENRKSAAEFGSPYLPSQQKSDLFIQGRIQAEMKSFDEAYKTAGELKMLIDKGINTKELRYYEYILGLIEFGKRNYQKAAELFERASGRLDFEPRGNNHALHFDAGARALYESGDLDSAYKEFEKITLLTYGRLLHGDIYAKAYYMLGKIAEQQGDKARARENYRQFLELWKDADPGLPEVEDARLRLSSLQ